MESLLRINVSFKGQHVFRVDLPLYEPGTLHVVAIIRDKFTPEYDVSVTQWECRGSAYVE